MNVLGGLKQIFEWCWDFFNIPFNLGGGFSFTLANVAEVAVMVWVASKMMCIALDGDWGED